MTFQTEIVDHLFRQQSGKMAAILTRIFGFQNAELIEDVVQESFFKALKLWPVKGMPENPEAWLMRVAKNHAINELKRKNKQQYEVQEKHISVIENEIERFFLEHEIKDSQLRVLFACCNPLLSKKAQIMLTLKILSGFNDREIANALLMKESAVRKGIYRARKELGDSELKIPFLNEINERFSIVITIIYLIFNEGYRSTTKNKVYNEDLCYEAIRLASLLLDFEKIDKGEVYALMALMYFTLARFPARTNETEEMIGIEMQDRSKWDNELLKAGAFCLSKSRSSLHLSRFHLESTIAALHSTAKSYGETNWVEIVHCYEQLLKIEDGFIVRLNYAIALGKSAGAKAGIAILKQIEETCPSGKRYLLYAAFGELYSEMEEYNLAKSYYTVALDHTKNEPDVRFIQKKLTAVEQKLATLPN